MTKTDCSIIAGSNGMKVKNYRGLYDTALHKCWRWFWPFTACFWFMTGFITIFMILGGSQTAWAETSENNESPMPVHSIEQQLNFATGFETNRTLGERWTFGGIYQLKYDAHYRFQTGLSYNFASGSINALFVELGYEKINNGRYSIRLKFLGNQYSEYNRAANSIIPSMHWENGISFIDAGLNYRCINVNETQLWNIFYYQTEVAEFVPYYQFGLKVSTKDGRYAFILSLKNFDEMYAGNLGAYRLHFNCRYTINDKISVFGNLDFWQSGGIVMANTYYKTVFQGGIEVKL